MGSAYILAGSLFYQVGTMVVTFAFNVPMNDAVATLDPASSGAANQWAGYLVTWTNWNHVRTGGRSSGSGGILSGQVNDSRWTPGRPKRTNG